MRERLLAALVVLALAVCHALSAATITILNTGDIHETSYNLPRIARYVKQLRAENPNVLFLDAGDRSNKGELELMVTRGKAIGRMMVPTATTRPCWATMTAPSARSGSPI